MIIKTSCLVALGAALGLSFVSGDARADAADTLVEECHVQLELSDGACECLGNSAREDLTSRQQDLVVAQVTEDAATVDSLQSQMTVEELTQAGEWMMNAPVVCEQQ